MTELTDFRRMVEKLLIDGYEKRLRSLSDALRAAEADLAAERGLVDRLKLEAQIWSGEARCHKGSLHEAYQAVTGAKGEPGNWNGARPIVEAVGALRGALAAEREHASALAAALEPFADEARQWGPVEDAFIPTIDGTDANFTLGDLRRAASVLDAHRGG